MFLLFLFPLLPSLRKHIGCPHTHLVCQTDIEHYQHPMSHFSKMVFLCFSAFLLLSPLLLLKCFHYRKRAFPAVIDTFLFWGSFSFDNPFYKLWLWQGFWRWHWLSSVLHVNLQLLSDFSNRPRLRFWTRIIWGCFVSTFTKTLTTGLGGFNSPSQVQANLPHMSSTQSLTWLKTLRLFDDERHHTE